MESTPESSAHRDRIKWSLLIFSVALALRALAIGPLIDTALLDTIMGDAHNYDSWARRIAAGDWIGDEVFYQAPLYPYFLATIYAVLGDDLLGVRAVQLLVGSASCALLCLAGWRWLSKSVGITAGLMLAVYAPAIFADLSIQKSVLDVFFVCLILWILGGVVDRPSIGRCIGLGASLGALILSRENAGVFVLVLGPWLLLGLAGPLRQRIAWSALFAAGIALVLLPVALRNWQVGGELHLTTSQFGHNFFIGNNEVSDGTYRPLIVHRGDPRIERQDAIALAERATGRELTPAEVSRFYTDRALEYIASHPLDWTLLLTRKLALALNAVELVDTKDQYSHGALSPVLRISDWLFHFGVLAPLVFLGIVATWPERARLLPLYLLFLSYTATLLLFYVFGRYRLPTIPIALLFAAAGVLKAREVLASGDRRRTVAVVCAMIAVAMVANWPISEKTYMRSVTHYNLANELVAAERVEEAIHHYRSAIALHDRNAVANHNLGSVLASRGELAAAIAHFDRAIEIDDAYAQAYFNRARALRESGDLANAIRSYERGLVVEPGRADVHLEVGLVYEEAGDRAAAAAHFERVLEIDAWSTAAREALLRARDGGSAGSR